MGYMSHDAVIAVVPGYHPEIVEAIEKWRASLAPSEDNDFTDLRPFVTGPVETVNGDYMYAVLPDGSKEGWGLSDAGDEMRAQFIDIARGKLQDPDDGPYYVSDVVHVRFGGDYGAEVGTEIVYTTDDLSTKVEV